MPQVFETLRRVSAAAGRRGRLPGWLSTHPDRGGRASARSAARSPSSSGDFSAPHGRTARATCGSSTTSSSARTRARGTSSAAPSSSPSSASRSASPQGWKTSNREAGRGRHEPQPGRHRGGEPLRPAARRRRRRRSSSRQQGIQAGRRCSTNLERPAGGGADLRRPARPVRRPPGRSRPSWSTTTRSTRSSATPRSQSWRSYDDVLVAARSRSFGPVTDRRALDVQPKRIDVVALPTP